MIAALRLTYEYGRDTVGNRATVFARAGDENTATPDFLADFANGAFILDAYAGLQTIIDFYNSTTVRDEGGVPRTSFNITSFAAASNWTTVDVLDTNRIDPANCLAGETPFTCELRLTRPAVVLIMFGTHDLELPQVTPDVFRANVQALVQASLSNGVIPVLSTIPRRLDGLATEEQVARLNTEIVNVAQAANIPLWNFWLAVRDLPNGGLSPDGVTLSVSPTGAADLSAAGLAYGINQRNLTALQVLDAVRQAVFPDALPPVP